MQAVDIRIRALHLHRSRRVSRQHARQPVAQLAFTAQQQSADIPLPAWRPVIGVHRAVAAEGTRPGRRLAFVQGRLTEGKAQLLDALGCGVAEEVAVFQQRGATGGGQGVAQGRGRCHQGAEAGQREARRKVGGHGETSRRGCG
ncbi:hypothetical protein D9M71_363470 [compost metagenome]